MKKHPWIKAIAISLIVIGSVACTTTKTIYVTNPLELPARPTLPQITATEAVQIPDATWEKITERNRLRRQYAEALETIINSTHGAE